jgi:hypothetical protein
LADDRTEKESEIKGSSIWPIYRGRGLFPPHVPKCLNATGGDILPDIGELDGSSYKH